MYSLFKPYSSYPSLPYLICALDSEFNTLRIVAKAKFITSEEAQKAAFEVMPALAKMVYAVGDGIFEIYTLEDASFTCKTMMGKDVEGIEL